MAGTATRVAGTATRVAGTATRVAGLAGTATRVAGTATRVAGTATQVPGTATRVCAYLEQRAPGRLQIRFMVRFMARDFLEFGVSVLLPFSYVFGVAWDAESDASLFSKVRPVKY